jgi:Flp pilus assembly protein CpaB
VPGRAPRWQRRLRRPRRLLAAALAGVVVWSLAAASRPAPSPESTVVVATHDLAPGTSLTAADLALESRPVTTLPQDPLETGDGIVGRSLVVPVRAGEPIRARDVLDSALLRSWSPGTVATPVRMGDPAAVALVRAGDLVDVIAAGETASSASATVVATGVRVLVVPTRAVAGTSSVFAGGDATTTEGDGSLVVLATTSAQAVELAQASVRGRLSFTLRFR